MGGIITYPTEAVWGLGCNPYDTNALARLLEIKRRSPSKGLILIASHFQQLQMFIDSNLSVQLLDKLNASWPGPITWIVPTPGTTSPLLRGIHHSIAVRVTAHPLASALCETLGHALVSTSANINRHPPARSLLKVRLAFGNQLDFYLSGSLGSENRPTEIRDLLSDQVLRK